MVNPDLNVINYLNMNRENKELYPNNYAYILKVFLG